MIILNLLALNDAQKAAATASGDVGVTAGALAQRSRRAGRGAHRHHPQPLRPDPARASRRGGPAGPSTRLRRAARLAARDLATAGMAGGAGG